MEKAFPGRSHVRVIVPNLSPKVCASHQGKLMDKPGRAGIDQRSRTWDPVQVGQDPKIWKSAEGRQNRPEPAYTAHPFVRSFEEIARAAHMAFSINQPSLVIEEAVRCLQQQEMLPDITGISCMSSVIVTAHSEELFLTAGTSSWRFERPRQEWQLPSSGSPRRRHWRRLPLPLLCEAASCRPRL